MEIRKIFVAGAGLMGSGIAQICEQAGYQVVMRDVNDDILAGSIRSISDALTYIFQLRPSNEYAICVHSSKEIESSGVLKYF